MFKTWKMWTIPLRGICLYVYVCLTLVCVVRLVQMGQSEPPGEQLQEAECLGSRWLGQNQNEGNPTSTGRLSSRRRRETWGGKTRVREGKVCLICISLNISFRKFSFKGALFGADVWKLIILKSSNQF